MSVYKYAASHCTVYIYLLYILYGLKKVLFMIRPSLAELHEVERDVVNSVIIKYHAFFVQQITAFTNIKVAVNINNQQRTLICSFIS